MENTRADKIRRTLIEFRFSVFFSPFVVLRSKIRAHSSGILPVVSYGCHVNPLNAELNPIRHLLALVGARHIVHVSRIRVWGTRLKVFGNRVLRKIFVTKRKNVIPN